MGSVTRDSRLQPMIDALARERDALACFVELLQREQVALVRCDPTEIAAFAAEKESMAKRISELDAKRSALLVAFRLPDSAAGMQTWLESRADDGAVQSLWKEIEDSARRAQTINQTNGKLINLQSQHFQNRLAVLRQAAAPQQLYGADGLTLGLASSRPLAAV